QTFAASVNRTRSSGEPLTAQAAGNNESSRIRHSRYRANASTSSCFAYNRDPRTASPRTAMSTTIAIVATGEMGSAVGAALVEAGYRVVTDLTGRSAQSRKLASLAGIEDVGSFRAIAETADIVLSILPPAHAVELGRRMAEALEQA